MNKFASKTKQGYLIVDTMVKDGRVYAIIKRDTDYAVACGYDDLTGTWAQGWYDYPSKEDAMVALVSEVYLYDQKSLVKHLLNYIQTYTEDSLEFKNILLNHIQMTPQEIEYYGKGYILED